MKPVAIEYVYSPDDGGWYFVAVDRVTFAELHTSDVVKTQRGAITLATRWVRENNCDIVATTVLK